MFKPLSDVEILTAACSRLHDCIGDWISIPPHFDIDAVLHYAFNKWEYPFFSRRRVGKLYEWINNHEVEHFLFDKIENKFDLFDEFKLAAYYHDWISHLIQEIENEMAINNS